MIPAACRGGGIGARSSPGRVGSARAWLDAADAVAAPLLVAGVEQREVAAGAAVDGVLGAAGVRMWSLPVAPKRRSLPRPPRLASRRASRCRAPPSTRSLPSPPPRRSLPVPPRRSSMPGPPSSRSLPLSPSTRSLPAPERIVSLPGPPRTLSLPAPEQIVSSPPRPSIVSAASLPTMTSRPARAVDDALAGGRDDRRGAPLARRPQRDRVAVRDRSAVGGMVGRGHRERSRAEGRPGRQRCPVGLRRGAGRDARPGVAAGVGHDDRPRQREAEAIGGAVGRRCQRDRRRLAIDLVARTGPAVAQLPTVSQTWTLLVAALAFSDPAATLVCSVNEPVRDR